MDGMQYDIEDGGGSKSRAWPGANSILAAWFNFRGGPRVWVRRLFMWIIFITRLLVSIFNIIFWGFRGHVFGAVMVALFGLASLIFMAWCLAMIGQAEGYRRALRLRIGRTHLDVFLGICAIIHILILLGSTLIPGHSIVVPNIFWFAAWVLIAFYGFLSIRSPNSIA